MPARLIYVLCAAAASIAVLFLLSRLIGNRQISELSLFDYINSITIGSLAADLAASASPEESLILLTVMIFYGVATFALAVLSNKSKRLRGFLEGEPIILMRNGKLYRSAFARARLDLNEFQADCRLLGYFDLSDIDTAIIEANGRISVLPAAAKQPLTVEAAGINARQEHFRVNVIMDGRVLSDWLHSFGRDEKWLLSELSDRGFRPEEVLLATLSADGELKIFTDGGGQPPEPF